MQLQEKHRIKINISGEIFETFEETLSRFPMTLLGDKRRRQKYYCFQTQQYFLERNRKCFDAILFFYQSNGTLRCPIGTPIDLFTEECNFFRIPKKFINNMKLEEGIFPSLLKEKQKVVKHYPLRLRVWNFLEDPSTSFAAWNFGLMSLAIVWLSILTAAIETMPVFSSAYDAWEMLELAMNTWFTLELILRAACSENISTFLRSYMNIIDILAVLPYYALLIAELNTMAKLIRVLKTLKFLRVCRLFRFTKHSKRLIVVVKILHRCFDDIRLLFTCLMIVVTLGGTFMFVIEQTPTGERDFESIPACLWWSLQTLTTLGYGDLVPHTLGGRLLASCLMLLGAVTISLPILTIVSEFVRLYPQNVELVTNAGKEKMGVSSRSEGVDIPLRPLRPIHRTSTLRK